MSGLRRSVLSVSLLLYNKCWSSSVAATMAARQAQTSCCKTSSVFNVSCSILVACIIMYVYIAVMKPGRSLNYGLRLRYDSKGDVVSTPITITESTGTVHVEQTSTDHTRRLTVTHVNDSVAQTTHSIDTQTSQTTESAESSVPYLLHVVILFKCFDA